MKAPNIPIATYRWQFNKNFTFLQAADLVPYLAALGISHCYASPYLRARPGSMHGYDIIDHQHLNPEIGTPEDYEKFVTTLHKHGMGQILDIVPNHMGIMGSDNAWWLDVLENGEASVYAEYFDIDWQPLKHELRGKVLVPVLGDQYGIVLDRGELKLTFDKEKGEFSICYFQHRFPVDPREYPTILRASLETIKRELGDENQDLIELQSLITAFRNLPDREKTTAEKRAERARDKESHKSRLAALTERSAVIAQRLESAVAAMNGTAGNSGSFDALHELIKDQAYRLAFWRVAADDINYRRFFDVNDLAALRQENEEVFEKTHQFVLRLLNEGKINGLRVDHPDGLYDPRQYFRRLQGNDDSKSHYVVAEKILTGDEKLPHDWPIAGTTGYGFSNLVNGIFVDPSARAEMDKIYAGFVGQTVNFDSMLYESKKLVISRLLNSELNVLANHLNRIALADRHTCDFTLNGLRYALSEVVACFPVYRTYVSGESISESDRMYIEKAVQCAKSRNTRTDTSVYDFIREVLLSDRGEDHPSFYQNSVIRFAMRFQQYTSALMAKGLEDTSFYRYHRLISLNDVGGDPLRFGIEPSEFHRVIQEGAEHWPHQMLATCTHDSKRSEDVRARINVLSEIPTIWNREVRSWREMNRDKKVVRDGVESPTANDEYLLYQTLVGAWPLSASEDPPSSFAQRIRDYMLKAVREAKDKTSWRNPDADYESALSAFVDAVLGCAKFRKVFTSFQRGVAFTGMLNSLAQMLIKLTAPGVPDFYQGNELWDFSLVDPDNRRPVDYDMRREVLTEIETAGRACCERLKEYARKLVRDIEDGRIKMYVLWRTLQFRKDQSRLFSDGEYIPLRATGEHAQHLLAFARRHDDDLAITVAPRLSAKLIKGESRLPNASELWRDTKVELPISTPMTFRNLFTGVELPAELGNSNASVSASQLFADFPVALLASTK